MMTFVRNVAPASVCTIWRDAHAVLSSSFSPNSIALLDGHASVFRPGNSVYLGTGRDMCTSIQLCVPMGLGNNCVRESRCSLIPVPISIPTSLNKVRNGI